jgi:ABC-type maltose transport system permease subunit
MKPSKIKIFSLYFFLLVATAVVLFPVFWVLMASLKTGGSLFSATLLPNLKELTLNNYIELLQKTNFLLWLKNTLFLCVTVSLIGVAISTTAGYAFSRFHFWGRKSGLMTMILLQMFPAAMAMVALFRLLLYLGNLTGGLIGLNTLSGLVLVYAGGSIPFNTWIVKGYLDSLPKELEESAYIDGATRTQTFLAIILPLLGPILAVTAIFNFIGPYADFIFPSIFLTGEDKFTLAVGMRALIANNFTANWAQFAAASMLGALPILIIFFALQKFLVEGLTKGALKG